MLRTMARRSTVLRSCAGRSRGTRLSAVLVPVAAGCALMLLTAGCGSGTASGATAASSPSASASGSGMTAYLTCLRQHGVNIPTTRPTARPTVRPTGGFAANSSAFEKAREACASLRPAGGFGGFGGGQFGAALQAFRTCMAAHGETIPTTRPTAPPTARPTARPTGAPNPDRFLNGLNPKNSKVAAALKACQSKLPRFGAGGFGGGAGTPAPSASTA